MGGVAVPGDSTDSDPSGGGAPLSVIMGEVTPSVDVSDVTSMEPD